MYQELQQLKFDNRFIRELPSDPEANNFCRQVEGACFSYVKPKSVTNPQLVAYSPQVANLLDLSSQACHSPDFVQALSGNRLLSGMQPYATCYGGHQFGNWAGQLGDGRAINLGEIVNQNGDRWALQLKGAGPTPYSRQADGLAVLRSSIREFLCSEAMYHLGVPTTRALSLVTTGELVLRDMFYDGNPKMEPGAVVCRVSPTFTRFGSFQIFAARGETDILKQLVDYTIQTDFPHLGRPSVEIYVDWFKQVCQLTAELIVEWMRVGFVHGVMNTDNMSILGLTIDYGPYGWLDDYDPKWTPNTTDAHGRRYCFGNQPHIAHWNLAQLAQSIYCLTQEKEPLLEALDSYEQVFESSWESMMTQKLGLGQPNKKLMTQLLKVLTLAETDMTIFYRQLAMIDAEKIPVPDTNYRELMEPLISAYYQPEELTDDIVHEIGQWLSDYIKQVNQEGVSNRVRRDKMNRVNPKYVLRNYLAQTAIEEAENGNHVFIEELLKLLQYPYDEQPNQNDYATKRPEWARNRPGCSTLSCSS